MEPGVSDSLAPWTFSCSTCVGYGISANGAAKVDNGALGAKASITVTGTPGGPLLGTASSDAVFSDMLTISGGTAGTSGVLELTYMLDGVISNTGTGPIGSSASLYMDAATAFQYDGGGMSSGSYVEIDGNGTYNDTVTFYVPFTYGTALSTDLDLDASAVFVSTDSTTYSATVDYYNTAALTSALVFDGTTSSLGALNSDADIAASSGLVYGPNGIVAISGVPEPITLSIFGAGLVGAAAMRRRKARRA